MILINLLPKGYAKKEPEKKKPGAEKSSRNHYTLKTWLILAGSGFSVVSVLIFIFFLVMPNASLESKLKTVEKRQAAISKDYKESMVLKEERDTLSKTVKYLNEYKKERILWAPVLNDLSDSTPSVLQLTRFYFREKEKANQKTKKKKKKKEQKIVKKDIFVIIEGVLPETQNESVINGFIENLVKTKYFSAVFSKIALVSIASQEGGAKLFRIQCLVKEKKK